ncbi:hypothetical protein H3N56_03865 [Cetobacterium sp. 2A]|uniref:hypothetical protein n=1 Tax=Cetobacterium sp. 2A TaxID=2754723 RepID=UPI00163BCD4F|nr:hypothetical protein [Cetobacterium sp. 2A]MBC2855233.1 hypothetical protein [Cetobacterium sp. 2A]MBC2855280.1 hypothetical protein [Cetobacterium sp. 2A]MBC2855634.1 hypothetical protein [Cetobacterium sp. 2A]
MINSLILENLIGDGIVLKKISGVSGEIAVCDSARNNNTILVSVDLGDYGRGLSISSNLIEFLELIIPNGFKINSTFFPIVSNKGKVIVARIRNGKILVNSLNQILVDYDESLYFSISFILHK